VADVVRRAVRELFSFLALGCQYCVELFRDRGERDWGLLLGFGIQCRVCCLVDMGQAACRALCAVGV